MAAANRAALWSPEAFDDRDRIWDNAAQAQADAGDRHDEARLWPILLQKSVEDCVAR
jgi:hypothetical protein